MLLCFSLLFYVFYRVLHIFTVFYCWPKRDNCGKHSKKVLKRKLGPTNSNSSMPSRASLEPTAATGLPASDSIAAERLQMERSKFSESPPTWATLGLDGFGRISMAGHASNQFGNHLWFHWHLEFAFAFSYQTTPLLPVPKRPSIGIVYFNVFQFVLTFLGDFNLQKLPLGRLEVLWE